MLSATIAIAANAPAESSDRLRDARIMMLLIAVCLIGLMGLMVLLGIRWLAKSRARTLARTSLGPASDHASAWSTSAGRVEVAATGLTGEGGAGPKIVADPPPPARPAGFEPFDPDEIDVDDDERAGEGDETSGAFQLFETDEFDLLDDDDDDDEEPDGPAGDDATGEPDDDEPDTDRRGT